MWPFSTKTQASDPLVEAAIQAAHDDPQRWWDTRWGTVLIFRPDVALYVGGGRQFFRFGVGMPPIYGRDDIAPINISSADKDRLWLTYKWVLKEQMRLRREKALASVGRTMGT